MKATRRKRTASAAKPVTADYVAKVILRYPFERSRILGLVYQQYPEGSVRRVLAELQTLTGQRDALESKITGEST